MKPLLFRCEATPALGTGHALRCLALAQEWMRRGGRAVFAMSEADAAIVARIRQAGAEVEAVAGTAGSAQDATDTATRTGQLQAAWTVVDGPAFDAAWDSAWPDSSRLLRIDDNGLARRVQGDLLLNQNLGAAMGDYPARPASCRLLLGPQFALLRPEFRDQRETPRGRRAVVTMGGSDPARATERVIESFLQSGTMDLAADFIVGAANPRRDELQARIEPYAPRLRVFVAPVDLPRRFATAAFAVTAGGTTVYELALFGTPMLVLATAENQRRTSEQLGALEAAVYLGWHADQAPAALAQAVAGFAADRGMRNKLGRRAATLVDGRGAGRVADQLAGGAA